MPTATAVTATPAHPATTATTTTFTPPYTLPSLLIRLRTTMESTKRRTWYELQRSQHTASPMLVRTTAELAKALEHFHVSGLSEAELRLLLVSCRDESGAGGGFSFQRLAARLYPLDKGDGWGFERRAGAEAGTGGSMVGKDVAERPRSGAGKASVAAAAPVTRAIAPSSTTSSFPVVFASPSSTATAPSNPASKAASNPAPATSNQSTAPTKPAPADSQSKRPRSASSSNRAAASLHHTSRYVKKDTAIGRVYSARAYESSQHESQRTAYVKYINEGYWVRV